MATKLSTLLGSSFTGTAGPAGTIEVGTVTTAAVGTPAAVTNRGTEKSAILDFTFPMGASGYSGYSGYSGAQFVGSSGYSGYSGYSGFSGYSGTNVAYPSAGIPVSTGSAWSTSLTAPPAGVDIGYKNVPWSGGADKTSSYTLATTDVGKFVSIGTSGSIVVPASTFSAGDIISIYNHTTGAITITCSAVTTYIGGTNTTKTSVSLATRGICTVFFYSASICIITGNIS